MHESRSSYPTRIAYDGAVRYIGPSGYGWPTVERLERHEFPDGIPTHPTHRHPQR